MHPSLENLVNRTFPKPEISYRNLVSFGIKTKTRELDLSVLLIDRYSLLLGMLSL